jgi:ribosomal protein S18 acetylase RimI-like enzyme
MACAVGPEQYRQWSQVVCQGFSEYVPVTDQMIDQMVSMCGASECWLAPVEQPVAGAAMGIHEDVALFYGDATLPADRRRGWQTALIAARLEVARKRGCTLAVVSVLPGSGSQRNYERAGFELVYMRVNLSRTFD